MRVSRSRAWRLLMPSFLKKSSSGVSWSRCTLKCSAARRRTSSVVLSSVFMSFYLATILLGSAWWVRALGKIGKRVGTFDELAQPCVYCGAHEKVAKDIDFLAQLIVGDWLDEFFGGDGGATIEFFKLCSGGAGYAEGVAFGDYLTD